MNNQQSSPSFKIINGIKWAYLNRGAGRNILVKESEYEIYKFISDKANVNFHHLYLQSQIMGLRSNVNPVNSLVSKFTTLKRKIKLTGGEIHFEVAGGDVYLTQIVITGTENRPVKSGQLYSINSNNGRWDDIKASNQIQTQFAAVNGLAPNIDTAAKILPDFIEHGYSGSINNYTLFHNPHNGFFDADWQCIQDSTGIRGGTDTAKRLAAAIKLAARENKEVNWTVHERGAAIFKSALRILVKEGGARLDKQTVFYANPVVNMEMMDKYRRKTGMKLADTKPLVNGYSLHQGMVAGNWISESAILWQQGNKGDAISKGAGRVAKASLGAITAIPGSFIAYPAWAVALIASLGPNLFPRFSNRGVITNGGSALDHYLFKRNK